MREKFLAFAAPAILRSFPVCARATTSARPLMLDKPAAPSSLRVPLQVAAISTVLGPLLDNFHSQSGVLIYAHPLSLPSSFPFSFTTAIFTPPLFALAGVILALGTLRLDAFFSNRIPVRKPRALASVAAYSALYYLSARLQDGPLSGAAGPLLVLMAAAEWVTFDRSVTGLVMGVAVATAGPALELVLLHVGHLYRYTAPEFAGVPLWIIPVYFAGATAVGNITRALDGIGKGAAKREEKS